MIPRGLRNIHTTENSCRDTLPCATGTTTPVFLSADGEATSKFHLFAIRQHNATRKQSFSFEAAIDFKKKDEIKIDSQILLLSVLIQVCFHSHYVNITLLTFALSRRRK